MTRDYKAFQVARARITKLDPQHERGFTGLPRPLGAGELPVGHVSVARVRPRTSKGITDLLLPETSTH